MQHIEAAHTFPLGRAQLARLVREASDVIHVAEAAQLLEVSRTDISKALARWTKQGWLRRVGHGAYVAASLDSMQNEHVLDDPWVLVPALFSPAYIGGWSAAEHWDMTEQIFNDTVVLTGRTLRERSQTRHGATFILKHIAEDKIFGTKTIWRGRSKIAVSDIHRTIVDMLDDPAMGGGIQHVEDCVHAYLARADRDDVALIGYADRLGNGAVFKRLGFLAERNSKGAALLAPCRERLSQGNAKLDSALDCTRLVSRWKLWVPPLWLSEAAR
ncbi:MAG: type IV toxin-antitoxin system AbiEi family antitoxin domain-containing protein [Alphaproteobacteria bacterium]|jgi:predicted transcriptional regulator of viral defense system